MGNAIAEAANCAPCCSGKEGPRPTLTVQPVPLHQWIEDGQPKSCANLDETSQEERRIDPMLQHKAVTYSAMCEGHLHRRLSEGHLKEHWRNLKKVAVEEDAAAGGRSRLSRLLSRSDEVVAEEATTELTQEPLAEPQEPHARSTHSDLHSRSTHVPQIAANRGRDLFEKIKLKKMQEEADNAVQPKRAATEHQGPTQAVSSAKIRLSSAFPAVRLPLSVQKSPSDGQWRLHGLHEDSLVKVGLEALDANRSTEGLLDFPRRQNGSSMLFKEPFMKSLLQGERDLKSTPASDVSAAQGDIKQLSLRQLLKLRALCLDYEPHRNESSSTQGSFVQSVDWALFEQLARQSLGDTTALFGSKLDIPSLRKFGFQLTLLVAAFNALSSDASGRTNPTIWAWWLHHERIFVNLLDLHCSLDFPRGGVIAVQDSSKSDASGRRLIEWNVRYIHTEEELLEFDDCNERSTWSAGAQGGTFISMGEVQSSLNSLKKVPPKE